MFKRLLLAAGIIAGLLTPVQVTAPVRYVGAQSLEWTSPVKIDKAFAAGTISLSLSQQFDSQGKPLNGGRLYFFQAGTTTPQSAYQDSGLTIAYPNPIVLDSAGRVPQFFLADGSIKIRLENAAGVTQVAADGILVIGASSGGGGGSPVDPTTIIGTGYIVAKYGTGALSGFVRLNGRTIGSATSGATERANADAQALFQYLWDTDANLVVSGGRGASSAADWAANKQITLPDGRGRILAGLDDMGGAAAGRLTSTYFGASGTTLGAAGGSENTTLTQAQLPVVTPTFTGISGTVNVTSTINTWVYGGVGTQAQGSGITIPGLALGATSGFVASSGSFTPQGSISSFGSGNAHRTVQPTMLVTNYIKL